MNQIFNDTDILEILTDHIGGELVQDEEVSKVVVSRRDESFELLVFKDKLERVAERINSLEVNDQTALYDDNSYEIIVREESSGPMRRFRGEKVKVENQENGINYELSPASDEYLVWLLHQLKQNLSERDVRFNITSWFGISEHLDREKETCLLDFVRLVSMRFLTLKISSIKKVTPNQFSK